MKFNDRKEFTYDPAVFRKNDVQTALKIHAEYIQKLSGRPTPKFMEVSRAPGDIDPLWQSPIANRTPIVRELNLPAIVKFDKANFILRRIGRSREQKFYFWMANLHLQEADYFPWIGDYVYYSGYRIAITGIEFDPTHFWQQTNVWLGLQVIAAIAPEGDMPPNVNPGAVVPAEKSPLVSPE